MSYQVLTTGKRTELRELDSAVRIAIFELEVGASVVSVLSGTVYGLGTLHRIQGGFVPEKVFVFQAVAEVEVDVLKRAMDFFFGSLLDTELYVKEVPRDSALYPQEAARLFGKPILAA